MLLFAGSRVGVNSVTTRPFPAQLLFQFASSVIVVNAFLQAVFCACSPPADELNEAIDVANWS